MFIAAAILHRRASLPTFVVLYLSVARSKFVKSSQNKVITSYLKKFIIAHKSFHKFAEIVAPPEPFESFKFSQSSQFFRLEYFHHLCRNLLFFTTIQTDFSNCFHFIRSHGFSQRRLDQRTQTIFLPAENFHENQTRFPANKMQ